MLKYYKSLLFLCCVLFPGCAFFPSHQMVLEKPSEVEIASSSFLEDIEDVKNAADDELRYGFVLNSDDKNQNRQKEADFLFIADTSYNMVKHLEEVPNTFKGFLPRLSPVLWKMGVTNADYDPSTFSYFERDLFKGRVMLLELNGNILPYKFLYPYFTNSEEVFLDTLKRYQEGDIPHSSSVQYINPCDLPPYCQGNIRSPIHSLISAFSVNIDLLRKNVDWFIAIIFTNGDDKYIDDNTNNILMSELQKYHGPKKKIRIYSIAIIPDDEKCLNNIKTAQYAFATASYSHNIHKVVRATGGDTLSICAPNYSSLADAIVQSL